MGTTCKSKLCLIWTGDSFGNFLAPKQPSARRTQPVALAVQQALLWSPAELSRQQHHSLHIKLHKSPQCSSLGAVPVLQEAPPCGATMGRSIRQSTFSSSCLMTDVQPSERWDWQSTAEALYNSCSSPPSSASPGRVTMMDGDITDCSQSR